MVGNVPKPFEKASPYPLYYYQLPYLPNHFVKLGIVFVSSAKFQRQWFTFFLLD